MADGNPKQLFLACYFAVHRILNHTILKKNAVTLSAVAPSPKVENKKEPLTTEIYTQD